MFFAGWSPNAFDVFVFIILLGLLVYFGNKHCAVRVFAILAGIIVILAPMSSGLLVEANAQQIANIGRNIVLSIISANAEREAMRKTDVWPSVASDFSGVLKDYTKAPDSETYFTDLMKAEYIEGSLGWYAFAGAGIPAAADVEMFNEGNYNAWNVMAGLDENASDDTPFLFTRNLNITMDDLRNEKVDLRSRLDSTIRPFGDLLVVFVTKGSAMKSLKAKKLTRENFLGGSVFNAVTNRSATILKAKGM